MWFSGNWEPEKYVTGPRFPGWTAGSGRDAESLGVQLCPVHSMMRSHTSPLFPALNTKFSPTRPHSSSLHSHPSNNRFCKGEGISFLPKTDLSILDSCSPQYGLPLASFTLILHLNPLLTAAEDDASWIPSSASLPPTVFSSWNVAAFSVASHVL